MEKVNKTRLDKKTFLNCNIKCNTQQESEIRLKLCDSR